IMPRIPPMRYHESGTTMPKVMMKPFSGTYPVDFLTGCTFSFRREVLERHRFSEFFAGYSQGEDLEMSLRVGRHWRLVCAGDARIIHNKAKEGRPGSFLKGKMDVRN